MPDLNSIGLSGFLIFENKLIAEVFVLILQVIKSFLILKLGKIN